MLGTAGVTATHPSRPAAGGVVHVYETGISGRADADVLTGAVLDHGLDHLGALDHGKVNKIVLAKGALVFPRTKTGRCDENIKVATVKLTWATGSGHVSF
jgi:2C-methyl-D-erythritol 2,4-cyclodiphosphate synthase